MATEPLCILDAGGRKDFHLTFGCFLDREREIKSWKCTCKWRANRFGMAVVVVCVSCVKLVYPQTACKLPSCSFAQQEAKCLKLSSMIHLNDVKPRSQKEWQDSENRANVKYITTFEAVVFMYLMVTYFYFHIKAKNKGTYAASPQEP